MNATNKYLYAVSDDTEKQWETRSTYSEHTQINSMLQTVH